MAGGAGCAWMPGGDLQYTRSGTRQRHRPTSVFVGVPERGEAGGLCGMEREVLQWHLRAGWQLRHDTLAFTARPDDDAAETSSNPYGVGRPLAKGADENVPQALMLLMEAVRDVGRCSPGCHSLPCSPGAARSVLPLSVPVQVWS